MRPHVCNASQCHLHLVTMENITSWKEKNDRKLNAYSFLFIWTDMIFSLVAKLCSNSKGVILRNFHQNVSESFLLLGFLCTQQQH